MQPNAAQPEIAIWVVNPVEAGDNPTQNVCYGLLSSAEKRRADRFMFEPDRLAYLTAHALIRVCLSQHATVRPEQWRFATTTFGKPYLLKNLPASHLQFSISHTRQKVACLVAHNAPCGVDIEQVGRVSKVCELAERFFTPKEAQIIRSMKKNTQPIHFTALWALKEAYSKAKGLGLSLPYNTFGFDVCTDQPNHISFHPPEEDRDFWSFHLQVIEPKHWLAATCRHTQGKPALLYKLQVADCIQDVISGLPRYP